MKKKGNARCLFYIITTERTDTKRRTLSFLILTKKSKCKMRKSAIAVRFHNTNNDHIQFTQHSFDQNFTKTCLKVTSCENDLKEYHGYSMYKLRPH